MRKLRKEVIFKKNINHLEEDERWLLAELYQLNIEDKIWPFKKQETFQIELEKILTENTNLTSETIRELSLEIIMKTKKKIGDASPFTDERYIAGGWKLDITEDGEINFYSTVSDKILTTNLSEETKEKLEQTIHWFNSPPVQKKSENKNETNLRAYLNCPRPKVSEAYEAEYRAQCQTKEISPEIISKMPHGKKCFYERSFWNFLKEGFIFWLTGRKHD